MLSVWAPLTTSRRCNQCPQTPIYHLLDLRPLVATHLKQLHTSVSLSPPRLAVATVSPSRALDGVRHTHPRPALALSRRGVVRHFV